MSASDLARPFYAVRSPAESSDDVSTRCRQFAAVMAAHQFFSHETAAALWGLPLPPWMSPTPLHVSSPLGRREPRDDGVIGHRLRLPPDLVTSLHGLAVCSAAETWAQLGRTLSVEDLVAAGDFIVGRGGLASQEDLELAVGRVRRIGSDRLREASKRLEPASESSPESRLRVRLVDDGLPAPEVQWVLLDSTGRFVARLDLGYPRYRVGVEYDGRQHAEHEQFIRDADRWYAVEREGWLVVRVLAHHLADGTALRRTRLALHSRGWRRPT